MEGLVITRIKSEPVRQRISEHDEIFRFVIEHVPFRAHFIAFAEPKSTGDSAESRNIPDKKGSAEPN